MESGDLVNGVEEDVGVVRGMVWGEVGYVGWGICELVGGLFLLYWMEGYVGFIMVGVSGVGMVVRGIFLKKMRKVW